MLRKYDDFLARLTRGPIPVYAGHHVQDGEHVCTGNEFEITRAVVRLEFAGYQYRHRNRPSPYVREVFSCGHSQETTLGCYPWWRPLQSRACRGCSAAIPPRTVKRWLREEEKRWLRAQQLRGGMPQ